MYFIQIAPLMFKKLITLSLLILTTTALFAQKDSISIKLENVNYAHPVKFFPISTEGQQLKMAYMDVQPTKNANGRTVVLFHGKNFAGYYWTDVIKTLTTNGYRVVVPDQIGFGKSSKAYIHYSFHQLASWSKALLESLNISKSVILGHSMGGMLATRYALMFPERTEKLLLEDPIGLEDYRTFIPYTNTEKQYQTELKATPESVRKYYQGSYFTKWKPEYDELVRIAGGVSYSKEFPRYAKVAAMTYTMIFEQPVVYEFKNLKVPTVLFIGLEDNTIVGKASLTPEQQAQHGQYKVLGKKAAAEIPGAKLIEFENCGHIPHLEIPKAFAATLLENL
ncbi:alpha/beta fold hydrolase [Pedobacter sp. SAFR-022]|uniref:alpha/beta fold hydrolase n=1 Tax=Pedobacter sp. SAFR-022 TaxID=3436861 RepID=UPI003F822E42